MFSTTTIQALLRSNTIDMARRRHALIGKPAPDISLPNYNGEVFELKPSSEGVPIVLFFYPKSGTYTSTKEACELRDAIIGKETLFKATKVKVVGISPDPVEIQKEFVEKQRLPYPVLSDVKGDARKAYQTGKGLLGLTYARVTFIIDSKGILRDSLDATLNYGAHVKFVNKWLEQLDEQAKRSDGEATAVNTPNEYATTAPKEEPAAADVAQVILELAGMGTSA